MMASCALDLAGDGPRTLDSVAGLMGMSKERARQIEAAAMRKVRKAFRRGY
jgi:DNA-directed RNA polymerase sigma subunit (sigma70/sigma32)